MTVNKFQKTLPLTPREIRIGTSVTTTGNSSEVNLGAAYSNFGLQVRQSGTSATIQLQGSLAGGSSDWFTLTTWDSTDSASGAIVWTTGNTPVTRVRTNVTVVSTSTPMQVWVSASY